MYRKTALTVEQRSGFGGSYHDSVSHAAMFNDHSPFDFGVKTAQLYSAELDSEIVNKKFTYHTVASGNYYVIPGGKDEYQWSVIGDADIDFRITEFLGTTGAFHGKDGQEFEIACDKDWLHEPAIVMTENPDLPPLRILGYPRPLGNQSFAYTVQVQSGDPNAYIPEEYLQPGKTLVRIGTATADELNQKYGPDQYSSMLKLRSHTGQFSNKIEFSDKFVRMEIAASKGGGSNRESYDFNGRKYSDAFSNHYVYQANLKKAGTNETIKKGVFISKAEARLLERTEMDREMMCEFGRLQITTDRDTDKLIKIAPGWREIVKDGNYFQHNGTLTLKDLYEYLRSVFFRRHSFKNRKIKLYSGEGGIAFLSALIKEEASTFQTIEPGVYINRRDKGLGYHKNELSYGAQFTELMLPMGVTVELLYDPIKDNDQLFKVKAPGTNLPLESFQIDIFDFGDTEYAAEGSKRGENITMVMQDGVEEYYQVGGVYDIRTGAPIDGSVRPTNSKKVGIYRTVAGSLCVWDTSRVGRIEWVID